MREYDDIDLTVQGDRFAAAWLNAWLSTSDDDERPVLYRSLLVEVFPKHLQIVATDSYTLIGAAAATVGNEDDDLPTLDEVPEQSFIVMDHDCRAPTLLKWVLAECKIAAKARLNLPTVHLAVRSAEANDEPTLDPSLDRRHLVITTDRERLTFDIFDGEYPPWRPLLLDHQTDPTSEVCFAPKLLARLGKIRDSGACPVEFRLTGATGPAAFDVGGDFPAFGVIMPVRRGTEVES